MKDKKLAQRIKLLRNRKGYSQEELSEKTGLSLRTIQRIENGETEARGDSLCRLANAFDVSMDELVDWSIQEDKGILIGLNFSAFSFILFPLLGILVPLIIWISKKDKVRKLNEIAKELLNFEITWTILFFIGWITICTITSYNFKDGDISPTKISTMLKSHMIWGVIMYSYNLIILIINSLRISNDKKVIYLPKIKFIR